MVALRQEQRCGQDWLGPELGLAPRAVSRILRSHLPYLRDCDPLTAAVIRASKTTAVRYERDRPGELVHMDVKKIGRIPDGGDWWAHSRQMGSTAVRKKARIGYDYVHSMVDDHSRLAYFGILPGREGHHLRCFPRPGRDLLRRPRHRPGRTRDGRQPLLLPPHPCGR